MHALLTATANSFRGFSLGIQTERALRQELAALALALAATPFVAPSAAWGVAMIGALILLLGFELLNTAIEKFADHVTPEYHPDIGAVKDIGSAAVFCALSFAALIWISAAALRFDLL
jgi:diacylglycerol kinase (ATP)